MPPSMALVALLEGTILAPTSAKAWGSGLLQLEFTKLNGIVIQGSGIINGRGQQWWLPSAIYWDWAKRIVS